MLMSSMQRWGLEDRRRPANERVLWDMTHGRASPDVQAAFDAGRHRGYCEGWTACEVAAGAPARATEGVPAPRPAADWETITKVLALTDSPMEGEAQAAKDRLAALMRRALLPTREGAW